MSDFWFNNINVLYENDNYLDFIPQKNMTRDEQLNSIVRLCIYVFIILVLFEVKTYYLYPFYVICLTILFHQINKNTTQQNANNAENFNNIERDKIYDVDSQNYVVQSGYYNSDNHLELGEYYDSHKNTPVKTVSKKCRKPTYDNPFMNPSILDFNVPDENREIYDEACYDTLNSGCPVTTEVDKTFREDLFRDVGDLYNARGGERQFYTVPSTAIPNDQHGFAQWLFGDTGTCKSDLSKCYPLENLRTNDNILHPY